MLFKAFQRVVDLRKGSTCPAKAQMVLLRLGFGLHLQRSNKVVWAYICHL